MQDIFRTVMSGDYIAIAGALPDKGSVVLVSGFDDAHAALNKLGELRGSLVDLDCKVQIADSRDIVRKIREHGQKPTLFVSEHLVAALPEYFRSGSAGFKIGPVEKIDRIVDRIPDVGAVIVVADPARITPIADRIVARRGVDLAHRVFMLVSRDLEQERRELGSTTLPVFYDPAFPLNRPRAREAYQETATTPAVMASPAPAPVRDPRVILAERKAILDRYEGKVRKAERRARRAVAKACLVDFVDALPTAPHVVLVTSRAQMSYVAEWFRRLGRFQELATYVNFLMVDVKNGEPLPEILPDGLPAFAAPGVLKAWARAEARFAAQAAAKEAAAAKADADAKAAAIRSQPGDASFPTFDIRRVEFPTPFANGGRVA